jgi:hypothetical protein
MRHRASLLMLARLQLSIVTSHSHALASWCSVSFVLASHSAGAPAGGTTGVSSHAGTTRGAAHARSACFADLSDHFIRRLNGYGGQGLCCGRQGQSKGNSSQSDHRLSPSLRWQLVMRLGQRMDKTRPSLPKALSARRAHRVGGGHLSARTRQTMRPYAARPSVAKPTALSAIACISDAPSPPGIGTSPPLAVVYSAMVSRPTRFLCPSLFGAARLGLGLWLVHPVATVAAGPLYLLARYYSPSGARVIT